MKKYKPFIVIGVLIIIVIIFYVAGTAIIESLIRKELQNHQTGSFTIRVNEVDVNLFRRQVTVYDISVENRENNQTVTVAEAVARGIHILKLLFDDEITINTVKLENPQVVVNLHQSVEPPEPPDEPDTDEEKEMEQVILKKLEVHNAVLLIYDQQENESDTLLYTNAGIDVWDLNIGNESETLRLGGHSAKRLVISVNNTIYFIPGGLYKLQTDSISLDSREMALNLTRLHLKSLHPKYETAHQTGVETDWFDIQLQQIDILDIDMNALLTDTAVIFKKAELENIGAHIFRDKRLPFPDKPDTKLPMAMLHSLPVSIHSDSILITNSRVTYEEHGEESTETGMVTFNELYASIYNLSNLSDSINGPTAMSVRAMVMNEALLKAEFTFPNNTHSYQYTASGNLAPVDLTAFNTMVEPSAFIRIDDGRLQRLDFEFTYDNDKSEGALKMEYENLGITILDQEKGTEKKIKTFLTETFVLKQNNLEDDNLYQEGTISFERDKKKSIFNYWWKSLFSGMQDILVF